MPETFQPPPGAVRNEFGFWVLPDGRLAPGQTTPGMQGSPLGRRYYDDAKKLWYSLDEKGARIYESPMASGTGTNPGGGGGLFRKNMQWNQQTGEWEAPIDPGKLFALGTGALLSFNGLNTLLGGAGAGGAGLTTGPTAPGAAASSWGPAGAATGLTTGPTLPGAAASSWGPAGTAGTTGGSGLLSKILGGGAANAGGTPGLGSLLALIGGAIGGKVLANNAAENAVPPELRSLLQLSLQRQQAQQPVFNAANQGIFSMLPNFARQGVTPPGSGG